MFLENLTAEQTSAIRCILKMSPSTFWQACKGKLMELPDAAGSVDPSALENLATNPKQLFLNFNRPRTREDSARERWDGDSK
ncbi:MAG: hypothetical protein CMJ64_28285 [Planctomycetaceae bacterium]|nr:hypothetical protein [Planctomycetaceae bacterium]